MSEFDTAWMPSAVEAAEVAEALGIDWLEVPFDLARFTAGIGSELARARGLGDEAPGTIECGRLALARLHEEPDFYGTGVEPEPEPPPV